MGKVFALPRRRKRAFIEALTGTMIAWAVVRLLPYRLWRRWLGSPGDPPMGETSLTEDQQRAVADVSWAFRAVERLVGTRFTCLMYALSCRSMLASRGVSSIVVLGVRRSATAPSEGLHAWVCVGSDLPIVGGDIRDYAVIARLKRTLNR